MVLSSSYDDLTVCLKVRFLALGWDPEIPDSKWHSFLSQAWGKHPDWSRVPSTCQPLTPQQLQKGTDTEHVEWGLSEGQSKALWMGKPSRCAVPMHRVVFPFCFPFCFQHQLNNIDLPAKMAGCRMGLCPGLCDTETPCHHFLESRKRGQSIANPR